MSAERIDPKVQEDDSHLPIQLSDGTRHASQEAADAYKAALPADDYLDTLRDTSMDKWLLGGAAATIGITGIILVSRHMKKD